MTRFKKFQPGDKVTYIGSRFAQKLSGSLGIVDAHVQRSDDVPPGVVVTFGDDSYIMAEGHLTRFQGRQKEDRPETDKPKDVEVSKRKAVGADVFKVRGGKRRSEDSE